MTNLATHLKQHHSSKFSIYLKDSGKSTNSGAMQQVSLEASITQSQPLSRSSNRYKELVSSVSIFIAKDMHPLSVVEGDGFKSLMKLAGPHLLYRQENTFRSPLSLLYTFS